MSIIIRKNSSVHPLLSEEMSLFAACARGVEDFLEQELINLGVTAEAKTSGGISFKGDISLLCSVMMNLRSANRIYIKYADIPAPDTDTLYRGASALPFHEIIVPEMTIAVSCTLKSSNINHSKYASLKMKDAIVDSIRNAKGTRPSVDTASPTVPLHIHIEKDICSVYLDPSGIPLDRRGYRLERGEAPLREHLAAAMIIASGWDGSTPFYDPFCGSGTILIEASMIAARFAPGLLRESPVFLKWGGGRSSWDEALKNASERVILPAFPIIGSDSDRSSIEKAARNLSRLPYPHGVLLQHREMENFSPEEGPGTIICNPPYGNRLGEEEEIKPLYRKFGDVLKKRCGGSKAFVLTKHGELTKEFGLKASRRIPFFNGPIECRLLRFDLYDGKKEMQP